MEGTQVKRPNKMAYSLKGSASKPKIDSHKLFSDFCMCTVTCMDPHKKLHTRQVGRQRERGAVRGWVGDGQIGGWLSKCQKVESWEVLQHKQHESQVVGRAEILYVHLDYGVGFTMYIVNFNTVYLKCIHYISQNCLD